MEYLWELVQFDGTRLEVPPATVPIIKKRISEGQAINTKSMVIPVNQIKYFRQTDKPYTVQPLLESAAAAFNEPMVSADGSMQVRWVKRAVTRNKWEKHYSSHTAYRKLQEEGNMVLVAFKLPVHQIDVDVTTCTDEEIKTLDNKRKV